PIRRHGECVLHQLLVGACSKPGTPSNGAVPNIIWRGWSIGDNGRPSVTTIQALFEGISSIDVFLPQPNVEKSSWIFICSGKCEPISHIISGRHGIVINMYFV